MESRWKPVFAASRVQSVARCRADPPQGLLCMRRHASTASVMWRSTPPRTASCVRVNHWPWNRRPTRCCWPCWRTPGMPSAATSCSTRSGATAMSRLACSTGWSRNCARPWATRPSIPATSRPCTPWAIASCACPRCPWSKTCRWWKFPASAEREISGMDERRSRMRVAPRGRSGRAGGAGRRAGGGRRGAAPVPPTRAVPSTRRRCARPGSARAIVCSWPWSWPPCGTGDRATSDLAGWRSRCGPSRPWANPVRTSGSPRGWRSRCTMPWPRSRASRSRR